VELATRVRGQSSVKCLLSVLMLALVSTSHAVEPAHAVSPPRRPAQWTQQDLIVSLHDLPRRYSCDDLWYKFRDVLLAIGARADYKILPYDCNGPAPRVQLKFLLPREIGAAQQQWADLSVTRKTVRLQPGEPATLDASDCELVKQMKDLLLTALPVKVVGSELTCGKPFEVSIAALSPVTLPGPKLAGQGR
jgi:hypothetical protein